MYVPFIASHFPTSPFVSFGFLVLCFPFIPFTPPVLIPFPFQFLFGFPFISPCFPVISTSCISLCFPFVSPSCPLHFTALPCSSPSLPGNFRNKHCVFYVFRKKEVKNTESFQVFGKRRRKTRTSKEPACFGTPAPRRLSPVERYQIAARCVGDPSPFQRMGGGGRLSFILSMFITPSNVGE